MLRARLRLAGLIVVLIAAAWLVLSSGGGQDGRPAHANEPTSGSPHNSHRERLAIVAALRHSSRQAAALGGAVEAAAMLGSWRVPAVVAVPGDAQRQMRMWSMSKVVTMVTLLRLLGWGKEPGLPVSAEISSALEGAIRRSENCRQRRIVLELQRLAGSTEEARIALGETLDLAAAHGQIGSEVEAPDPSCVEYLESQQGLPEPLEPALLLGTSTWRVGDAVRFIHALGSDRYGAALSARVLTLLRAAKEPSREVPAGELTARLDWGAGRAFAGFDPAYKAGWGGTQQSAFLAGQIALVELPSGEPAAVAVMFHPDLQPPSDDPGRTAAPKALELVMAALAKAMQ